MAEYKAFVNLKHSILELPPRKIIRLHYFYLFDFEELLYF